jgi:hypothetical protein
MLHSSEFMPGGSPIFPTEADIENLYTDLGALFAAARKAGFRGTTLAEYAQAFQPTAPLPPRRQEGHP